MAVPPRLFHADSESMIALVAQPAIRLIDDDAVVLRRTGVRFPVELRPQGFRPEELSTWPDAEGRLEWVEGRLLYMPPCADIQQDVAVDLVHVLRTWSESHPEFVVGGNEAGMMLGGDIRAADAAVWRRDQIGPSVGKLRNVPPVLAAEVAGQDEDETTLREKAQWYLRHGVEVVWLIFPETRDVLVVRRDGEARNGRGTRLAAHELLADLTPLVDGFFAQIDRS